MKSTSRSCDSFLIERIVSFSCMQCCFSFVFRQFTDGYQLIAPLDKSGDDGFGGGYAGGVDIMHQDNVSVLYVIKHCVDGVLRISNICPVSGVDGPVDGRQTNGV